MDFLKKFENLIIKAEQRQERAERHIEEILHKVNKIMATLDQVVQDVSDESTLDDSVLSLLQGIQQQLADALAGTTLPPATQAKIDAVFTGLESNKAKLSKALVDNTPVQP